VKVINRRVRLDAAGATAVFVTHDRPGAVRGIMLRDVSCPYPIAVDRDRNAYRQWGLRRLALPLIWLDPSVWRQYTRLLAAGEQMRRSDGDQRQMGGDFVVNRDGVVVYARPQRRDDRPAVSELLKVIEAQP
jgi:hypothetical protein